MTHARPSLPTLLALLLAAILLLRPGQTRLPPIDRDESRYAQATMQMIDSGNYIDVRFQDQPRYLQPAGIYWLQALSFGAFGTPGARHIWVHRIPSMLGGIVAILMTALLGTRLFGRAVGTMAALLLAASVLLGFEARIATIDATLLAVIMVGQYALATIYLSPEPHRRSALLFWAALGTGIMLKGPVIALVLLGTLAALAVSERRVRWMARLRPLTGLAIMLAITLPWFIAIAIISRGDFFARSVGRNFLGKVAAGQEAHGQPPGFYLLLFSFTFWPAAPLAIRALPWIWRSRRDPRIRYLICWIVPTWLVFELVATKLPHYVLPTYPAIAMLAAAAALAPDGWTPRPWQRIVFLTFAAMWLLVGIALSLGLPVLLWWQEGTTSPLILTLALAALAVILLTAHAAHRQRMTRAALLAAAAALLVSANAYRDILPRLSTIWLSPRIAALVDATRPCPTSVLASTAYSEPSLVYLVGTATRLTDIAHTADSLRDDPACALALVGSNQKQDLLARLADLSLVPRELGEVQGVNYSNGRRLKLELFAVEPEKRGSPDKM